MSTALLLGGNGLLGQALQQVLQKEGWTVLAPKHAELDLTNPELLTRRVEELAPEVIFNAVAYTRVDDAEEHPQDAMALNRGLPALLGRIVQGTAMYLVHVSTDFVFNGKSRRPYVEADPVDPLSVYGRTKLEGEQALLERHLDNCCIVRTAWLFGPERKNFVSTILHHAKKMPELRVVHDQTGSPTYTLDLAQACLELVNVRATGLCHVVNSGQASWCELAAEAVRLANYPAKVRPIPSSEWPQKAVRPAYGVLDTSHYTALTGKTMRPWIQALQDYVFTDFLPLH